MFPYTIVLIILIFVGGIGLDRKYSNKKILYFFVAALFVLFVGLRGNGFDWISYEEIYNGIRTGSTTYSGTTFIEYGFRLLIYLSPSYRILILLTSCVSIWMSLSAIYKLSRESIPLLGLLIFFTTFCLPTYMGQIRQGIAIGFVLWSYIYCWENNKTKSILFILIGCFFHMSALIAFLIFLPIKRTYKIKIYMLGLVCAYISSKFALILLGMILNATNTSMGDKILYYAQTESFELGISSTILIRILTLFLVLKLNHRENSQITYLTNIYFIGIVLYLIFGFAPQIAGRGTYCFSIMETILVPYLVLKFIKHPILYLGSYFCIVLLSFYRFLTFFGNEYNYQSYVSYFHFYS